MKERYGLSVVSVTSKRSLIHVRKKELVKMRMTTMLRPRNMSTTTQFEKRPESASCEGERRVEGNRA